MEQREQSNRPRETSLDPMDQGNGLQIRKVRVYPAAKKGASAPDAVCDHALLAALPEAVVAYSADGHCRWANAAAGKLLGVSRECLLEQNFREIPFWKASGLLHLADETLRSGRPHHLDTPCPSDSDESRWLDFRLARVELDGKFSLLVILADATDCKRVEEDLRAREERCRALADVTSDLIFSFDRDLNLTGLNQAAARSLGLPVVQENAVPSATARSFAAICATRDGGSNRRKA